MAGKQPPGFSTTFKSSVTLGGALGALMFVVNYIITFVFLLVDNTPNLTGALWKQIAWFVFNGHTLAIQSAGESVNLISEVSEIPGSSAGAVPNILYYVIPIAVLTIAGYYVYDSIDVTLGNGGLIAIGATIATGYGLLVLIMAVFSTATGSEGSIGVSVPMAVLLAGILYPVFFGTAGAIIARETN